MFKYNDDNFIFDVSWTSISTHSKFDELFKKTWIEKEEKNLFRYKYKSQNVVRLPGKYQFIKVLNIDRATKRRTPASFHKVLQPFDDSLFNFTKINHEEYLFKLESPYNSCENSSDDILAINSSPLGDFHSLILPKISSKLPQSINNYSLHLSLQILLLSASPAMRIGYNSLCAYASVNHLHLHFYYLPYKMYLETCEVEYLSGSCYIIKDYPGKGFVFFLCSIDKILDLVRIF
ncbi:GDP-D-glucose phosphorylase 1 [Daktulosphaira vitifoliae]|uniref:GDP-D-glucose phosphorylase 1 n=1 Tax=Daktulosphaira vitifoliae TaxID=58002 RepID=UPI0021A9EFAA|nr:GDP-D-glucose phosphorylase 1 [Daktulosphaira vitifoliae]